MTLKKIALYVAIFLVIVIVFFYFVYRPWNLRWGATDEEVNRSMIGDDIVKNPTFNATRAVTINASPEEIWPWIIQIGYKRAGFYSYDFLDNDGIPSAERVLPDYQNLKVGDRIPLDRDGTITVAALEPNKHMLLASQSERMTWAWGLYQTDAQQTRLVTRLRVRMDSIVPRLLWDTFEIVMMRKCLLGIKRRAESSATHRGGE
jgi:hypothetical protein